MLGFSGSNYPSFRYKTWLSDTGYDIAPYRCYIANYNHYSTRDDTKIVNLGAIGGITA